MLDKLRQTVREAMSAGGPARAALMRAALVEAKVGLAQVRDACANAQAQLEAERAALVVTQRRGSLAAQIGDAETVRVAARFEARHQERIGVLERKAAALLDELSLFEREVEEMGRQLRAAASGAAPAAPTPLTPDEASSAELDALRRAADKAARESAADKQLEWLKKKMGR